MTICVSQYVHSTKVAVVACTGAVVSPVTVVVDNLKAAPIDDGLDGRVTCAITSGGPLLLQRDQRVGNCLLGIDPLAKEQSDDGEH